MLSCFYIVFIIFLFSFTGKMLSVLKTYGKYFCTKCTLTFCMSPLCTSHLKNYKFPWSIKTYVNPLRVKREIIFSFESGTTLLWYDINWNIDVFISTQWHYQINYIVKAHVPCSWSWNGTVNDELVYGYLYRSFADISWVTNHISLHCESRSLWLLCLWPIIHYNEDICQIFDSIHVTWYISVNSMGSVLSMWPPDVWDNLTSSLAKDCFHIFLYMGCLLNLQYINSFPLFS